jgi:acetolactate synthase-1/2/3 large subunit
MKGGDILIECLKEQGVRCVFGMPGTQNLHIYDALLRLGEGVIDHYLVRHEYAATLMADGYARSTGEVGVALTVPGPGASNAATGILEAFTDRVPVLLITGQSHSNCYMRDPGKMFHGLDQMRFFDSITKYRTIARSVEDIPVVVEEAFRCMRSGLPGPAVLEFPADVIQGTADTAIPPRVPRTPVPPPDDRHIRSAAEALKQSKRPILFAGAAVICAGARGMLRQLAEKLHAPVFVTRRGKGALPDDHPLALHHSVGFKAREALKLADCTLAIGPRFTSLDTKDWSMQFPRPLIQIDEDASEIGREYACDVGVVGDLKVALMALTEKIDERQDTWKPLLDEIRSKFASQPALPILPSIRQVLPPDGILAMDVHSLGYLSFAEFPIHEPRTFLYPCIAVSLGYAFPAALGAKIAHPDRPVVCFTGDGGFMMGLPELPTAVKYKINVVTVIVNDGALTSIKGAQQKYCDGRIIDSDLFNPDFVRLAESCGAVGVRVENLSQFSSILRKALDAARPTLLEVPMQDRQGELIGTIDWLHSEPLLRTPQRPGER